MGDLKSVRKSTLTWLNLISCNKTQLDKFLVGDHGHELKKINKEVIPPKC